MESAQQKKSVKSSSKAPKKEVKLMTFKEIDRKAKYKFKTSRLMAAVRAGHEFISEHIAMTYRETKSLRKTGKICGDISSVAVKNILKKCGEQIREPGGRVWSKLSKENVEFIRNYGKMGNKAFKKLALEFGVTPVTIRNVYVGRTHAGV